MYSNELFDFPCIFKKLFQYDADLGSHGLKICNYSWLPLWNKKDFTYMGLKENAR